VKWTLGRWPRARTVFGFATIATIALMVVVISTMLAQLWLGRPATQTIIKSEWLQVLGFLVGVVGALSALCLWIGMLWHCGAVYRSSSGSRLAWFLLLVFGNWLAAPVYYVLVYRRQTAE
jgi:hypothetical protein